MIIFSLYLNRTSVKKYVGFARGTEKDFFLFFLLALALFWQNRFIVINMPQTL